jgi:DNA-directed RNA polymerase subunit RPC12/RpoP
MKPTTKLQHEVMQYSRQLHDRKNELFPWAKRECLAHEGYATKNRVICMDCGERFPSSLVERKRALCPHCGTKLTIKQSQKRTWEQRVYFAIAEIVSPAYPSTLGEDTAEKKDVFQVIRNFELRSYHKAGAPARCSCTEVLQYWVRGDGKYETVARNHAVNFYHDSWNGDMEIRKNWRRTYSTYYDPNKYDVEPYRYHPGSEFRAVYRKYGINCHLQGIPFLKAVTIIPKEPQAETLLKAGYYTMMGYFNNGYRHLINRYWASIKIAIRNRYKIEDAGIWFDYLEVLSFFNKDLHNAHYVCPKNLHKAHDLFVAKKRKANEIAVMRKEYVDLLEHFGTKVDSETFVFPKNLKAKRDALLARKRKEDSDMEIKAAMEYDAQYREFIGRFAGLEIKKDDILIRPLLSVEEFKQEGDALLHCVFTNEYYKKRDMLLLTAQVKGMRTETVEFNLVRNSISQCRGRQNKNSPYHEDILKIVNKNRKRIAELKSLEVKV